MNIVDLGVGQPVKLPALIFAAQRLAKENSASPLYENKLTWTDLLNEVSPSGRSPPVQATSSALNIKNVLIGSPEVEGFYKKGGLADVVRAIAKVLARLGLDISIVTFLYDSIDIKKLGIEDTGKSISISIGERQEELKVYRTILIDRQSRVSVYLLSHPVYSHKAYLEYFDPEVSYQDYASLLKAKRIQPVEPQKIAFTMQQLAFGKYSWFWGSRAC